MLIKYYIKNIIKIEDVTKKYENGIRLVEPNYKVDEPRLQVTLKINSYGTTNIIKKIWKQSEFEFYKEQGYFEE